MKCKEYKHERLRCFLRIFSYNDFILGLQEHEIKKEVISYLFYFTCRSSGGILWLLRQVE